MPQGRIELVAKKELVEKINELKKHIDSLSIDIARLSNSVQLINDRLSAIDSVLTKLHKNNQYENI